MHTCIAIMITARMPACTSNLLLCIAMPMRRTCSYGRLTPWCSMDEVTLELRWMRMASEAATLSALMPSAACKVQDVMQRDLLVCYYTTAATLPPIQAESHTVSSMPFLAAHIDVTLGCTCSEDLRRQDAASKLLPTRTSTEVRVGSRQRAENLIIGQAVRRGTAHCEREFK